MKFKVSASKQGNLLSVFVLASCLATSSYALPISVNLTIPRVKLIEGTDPFGKDELYSKASINSSGFQVSGIVGGVDDGETIFPNWRFNSIIDPRGFESQGRTNYNVPISLQLWDDDAPLSDEQIDINPRSGRTLSFNYNLETRTSSLSSPQTGNPPGDQATLYFSITSNPFAYSYDVTQLVSVLGPGIWEYSYNITNLASSTFDIENWAIPNIGLFDISLQPGQTFNTGPFRSTRAPNFANSSITYDNLSDTNRIYQLLVPVSEPASFALISLGLLGMSLIRRKEKAPARDTA